MSISLLTDSQRLDLHKAIVSYLTSENRVSHDTKLQLYKDLGISEPSVTEADPRTLERKWLALIRLQRKLLDLEQQIATLKQELNETRLTHTTNSSSTASTSASSIDNWLPRWPPHYTLEGHRGRVMAVSFHPKWSLVASGSDDGSIKVWDYEQGEIEQTVRAHTRAVHSLAFSPLSKLLISCSADLSIRVWDPSRKFANTLTLVGHDHTVSAVTAIVDPRTSKEYIVSASRDKTIRVWELATGFAVRVIRSHTDWVRTLDATPLSPQQESDSAYFISAGSDRTVRLTPLFENMGGESSTVFEGHTNVIECCAVAPHVTRKYIAKHYNCNPSEIIFASGGRDTIIMVWASGGKDGPILKLKGHDNWVQDLAFHPNGRFLVSVGDDKTMRIWDLATAKLCKTIPAHEHFVTSIAWHGKNIATGSVDQTIRIW